MLTRDERVAGRTADELLADRAAQRARDVAVTSGPDHDQCGVGVTGGRDKSFGRFGILHASRDLDVVVSKQDRGLFEQALRIAESRASLLLGKRFRRRHRDHDDDVAAGARPSAARMSARRAASDPS